MFLIKGIIKHIWIFSICGLIFVNCSPVSRESSGRDQQLQAMLIEKADKLIAGKKYSEAESLLQKYLHKYPDEPYSDDAAFRIARLRVNSESENPFFNYQNARERFDDFKKKFPNSSYISACNDWLKILNLYNAGTKNIRYDDRIISSGNSDLEKQIAQLKTENEQLRKILSELEQALER